MAERKYDGRHTVGDLPENSVQDETELGPCPACGAIILVGRAPNPLDGGRLAKSILHPMPFCHYYGATSPEQIEADIQAAAEVQ